MREIKLRKLSDNRMGRWEIGRGGWGGWIVKSGADEIGRVGDRLSRSPSDGRASAAIRSGLREGVREREGREEGRMREWVGG